jgi:hypothetical protein
MNFNVKNGFRVKVKGYYPWPNRKNPKETIQLFPGDLLSKNDNGTYCKQTGIACFNIHLTDDQVEPWPVKNQKMKM